MCSKKYYSRTSGENVCCRITMSAINITGLDASIITTHK